MPPKKEVKESKNEARGGKKEGKESKNEGKEGKKEGKEGKEEGKKNKGDIKSSGRSTKPSGTDDKTSTFIGSEVTLESPRTVSLCLILKGEVTEDFRFSVFFDGKPLIESIKWADEEVIEIESMPLDLKDPYCQSLLADSPLILLLRIFSAKPTKELDPLINPFNIAGANVDLCPLILGQDNISVKVRLLSVTTSEEVGLKVIVHARSDEYMERVEIPLHLTMLSAHCLPPIKEGTVYVAAISMDGLLEPRAVNFGMSLSDAKAKKIVWATASTGGNLANTAYNIPDDDKYICDGIQIQNDSTCTSVYWNAMKRVFVDPMLLRERLSSSFFVEIAGVPRLGKVDVRGRYMGFIDAGVLLEPAQFGVTISCMLQFYSDAALPENVQPLLELPGASAKSSVRDPLTGPLLDEFGHNAYITLRLDLMEPLTQKPKIAQLFDNIGFPNSEITLNTAVDELKVEPPPEDNQVDVRRIRGESGALAVHKELSTLACRGAVPMNQSIKRTAANRLLIRVRLMLKQFSPGDCSYLDWQDSVTAQHAAARRAVTASFAPQPPAIRAKARVAAARCRMAGDKRIADKLISRNLKAAPNHPRPLIAKALRLLEERNDREARKYIMRALDLQTTNRFILWMFGGQEYAKGENRMQAAKAAIRLSVRGDHSDGTAIAVGWAAMHALYHHDDEKFAAFIAAKRMRKSFELINEWKKLLKRWTDTSGEEEILWVPAVVASHSPMLMAAAVFLCLRCFDLTERLLKCYEEGCWTRGSRLNLQTTKCADVYYIRAASWILRRQVNKALEVAEEGIKKFGPSGEMSQIRAVCLAFARGWDGLCESAFRETEIAGSDGCPTLLLRAAAAVIKIDPKAALQRAARAHKLAPGSHSALLIGRIYAQMGKLELAERWGSAAVKFEPLLSDGWAFLALLQLYERDVNKARHLLRTAKQAGPVSPDLDADIQKLLKIVHAETLPDIMLRDLCLCDYY